MSKRARRLWLGDWQRADDEPTPARPVSRDPDQGDTFVILPDDDADAKRDAEHRRGVRRAVASVAAIAVLCALLFAVVSGGDDNRRTSARPQVPPSQTPQLPQTPQVPQGSVPPGFGAPDLTGAAAEKAAKAALSKFPGDIERVTEGPAGDGYVVHVIQRDGSEVHVVVSDKFKVLGSDAGGGAPPAAPAPQGGSANPS